MDTPIFAWAIQEVSTGLFLPPVPKGQRNGATNLEPQAGLPRLFARKQDATYALRQWMKGKQNCWWTDEGDQRWTLREVPERVEGRMEIVQMYLRVSAREGE